MLPLNALNCLGPSTLITKVSLVWYCSQLAMQNIVLLMLTLVNMEVQTIVASWEVLVYIKRVNVPAPTEADEFEDPLPCFLLGYKIFPLKTWLMRPFPGSLDDSQKIFNYRLSRARHPIENEFGILVARWRIFKRPIRASIATVQSIIGACVYLHNYLQTAQSFPAGNYMFKVNNRNIRTRCEICSKLTIKTPERR